MESWDPDPNNLVSEPSILRAMANKKGGAGASNAGTTNFERDLQSHREELTAQLVAERDAVASIQKSAAEMQRSVGELQRTVATFGAELIAEMRLLLLETRPKAPDPVGNVTVVVDPAPISFGSLPETVGGKTLTGVAAAASTSVPTTSTSSTDLRARANKKGGAGGSSQTQAAADASHVELDFQVHREETAVQLLSLQDSVTNLQGSVATKETPALPAIVASSSELTLATANPKGPVMTSATTVAAANVDSATKGSSSKLMPLVYEPNKYRELSHHEVILGVNHVSTTVVDMVSSASTGSTKIDCANVIGSTVPYTDVNKSRRVDSGKGSNLEAPIPQYFQHTNFGTNPFNYMTGPFPAAHFSANMGHLGLAPTTHVSTIDPSLAQLPSFYQVHPYLPPTPIQLSPTSNTNQPYQPYQPQPQLPNTYPHTLTYTYPHTLTGNQVCPPHPNFGSQSVNGAWLHGHYSPHSNVTTQVVCQRHGSTYFGNLALITLERVPLPLSNNALFLFLLMRLIYLQPIALVISRPMHLPSSGLNFGILRIIKQCIVANFSCTCQEKPSLQFMVSIGISCGSEYRARLLRKWRFVYVTDCCGCDSYLVQSENVDGKRLCINVGSASQYTSSATLVLTDFFKAEALLSGVADFNMFKAETHRLEYHYMDNHVDDDNTYFVVSPISLVVQCSFPMILFQGLEDKIMSEFFFLRHPSATFASTYTDEVLMTIRHKFFRSMLGYVYKDMLILVTYSSVSYSPFHAPVRQLFSLSHKAAIQCVQPILASAFREADHCVLSIYVLHSINQLLALEQGLEIRYGVVNKGNSCSHMSCSLYFVDFMSTWLIESGFVAIDYGDLALLPHTSFSVPMLSSEALMVILLSALMHFQLLGIGIPGYLLLGANEETLMVFSDVQILYCWQSISHSHVSVHTCVLMYTCQVTTADGIAIGAPLRDIASDATPKDSRHITYQVIGRLAEPMPSLLRISTACASVEIKYLHHFQLFSTYVIGVTTSRGVVFVFVCWDQGTHALVICSEVINGYTISTVALWYIIDRADTLGMHGFSIPGPFRHNSVWTTNRNCFSRPMENLEAPFLFEKKVIPQLITSDLSQGTAETGMQHMTSCLTNVDLLLRLLLLTLTKEISKLLILVYSYPCQLTGYCLSILLSAVGKWMHGVDWMINTVKVNGMASTAAFLAQSRPEDMPCSKGGGMLGLLG